MKLYSYVNIHCMLVINKSNYFNTPFHDQVNVSSKSISSINWNFNSCSSIFHNTIITLLVYKYEPRRCQSNIWKPYHVHVNFPFSMAMASNTSVVGYICVSVQDTHNAKTASTTSLCGCNVWCGPWCLKLLDLEFVNEDVDSYASKVYVLEPP